PTGKVISALNDHKRRDAPPAQINTFNNHSLFIVTKLDRLCFTTSISAIYDNHPRRNLAYYKPNLIKVIDIRVYNAV
ncbi:hypothetical protein K456DRAFT_1805832, partial [Colletotrichum gloeosporioides 23]